MRSKVRHFAISLVVFTFASCFAIAGCTRNDDSVPNDAGVDAVIEALPTATAKAEPPRPPMPAQKADPGDISVPPSEPIRKIVSKIEDEPRLARQRDAILGFYKDEIPWPLEAQFEALPGSRQAILVQGKKEAGRPFVMAIDANGTRAWTKDMALAGIVPGVRDVSLVRGTESAVGIAFCDSTGERAALRMWNEDGSINADFEVMEVPHCEQISAIFIPGVGHVIGSTGETTARLGMIAANGMRVWDSTGVPLPWTAMARTALTIAVDSDNSFVVVGVDIAEKEKRRPNDGVILAMRYDFQGRALWPSPAKLGPRMGRTTERIRVRPAAPGKLDVEINEKADEHVELTSDGVILAVK